MLFISVAATRHRSCFHLQCSLFLLVSLVDDVVSVSVAHVDAALVSVAPVDVSPADAAFAAAFFVLLGIASFSTCVVCNVCNSQCRRMPDGALVHLPIRSTPHPCSKVRLPTPKLHAIGSPGSISTPSRLRCLFFLACTRDFHISDTNL